MGRNVIAKRKKRLLYVPLPRSRTRGGDFSASSQSVHDAESRPICEKRKGKPVQIKNTEKKPFCSLAELDALAEKLRGCVWATPTKRDRQGSSTSRFGALNKKVFGRTVPDAGFSDENLSGERGERKKRAPLAPVETRNSFCKSCAPIREKRLACEGWGGEKGCLRPLHDAGSDEKKIYQSRHRAEEAKEYFAISPQIKRKKRQGDIV